MRNLKVIQISFYSLLLMSLLMAWSSCQVACETCTEICQECTDCLLSASDGQYCQGDYTSADNYDNAIAALVLTGCNCEIDESDTAEYCDDDYADEEAFNAFIDEKEIDGFDCVTSE